MPSLSSSPEVIRLYLLAGSVMQVQVLVVVGGKIRSWGTVGGRCAGESAWDSG